MTGIGKRFGDSLVLREAGLEIRAGEVHVLAGENGAGKSTLIRILAGLHPDYAGLIEIDGRRVHPSSPQAADALGIAVVHQELSLIPSLSVADNLFLDRFPTRLGFVRSRHLHALAQALLDRLGIPARSDSLTGDLPVGVQQQIEIAKAIDRQARVLIMDEPTSALTRPEVASLFTLIASLKKQGRAIVYITHKMEEIEQLADRITVLRDGCVVGSGPAADIPTARLIRLMVGRDVETLFPRHAPHPGPERLCVEHFSVFPHGRQKPAAVSDVSFSVRQGEILGIGGLQGSGASELLTGLFGGYGDRTLGSLRLDGRPVTLNSPREAIRHGVALLTSDRKATGLVLPLSVTANVTLAALPLLSPAGWRRPTRETRDAAALAEALNLRAASLEMAAGALSGGNQQKVVLAKWLLTKPALLLLDEPTRGIDVGAKREIYSLMNQWTREGLSILLITSELPELLALSDRLLVLHRGRLAARFDRDQATPEAVMAAAMGEMETDRT
jgi:ABC-type sugar transport system ATPase subunit